MYMEKAITIPKELAKKDDLVIIPRKEYEEFSQWRTAMKSFPTFTSTAAQKRDLKKAREDYRKGNYMTLDELKRKLEVED